MRTDLSNDFTTGDNRYPKDLHQTLNLLDKYSKTTIVKPQNNEGSSFQQQHRQGKREGGGDKQLTYDRAWWKERSATAATRRDIQSMPVPHYKIMMMTSG